MIKFLTAAIVLTAAVTANAKVRCWDCYTSGNKYTWSLDGKTQALAMKASKALCRQEEPRSACSPTTCQTSEYECSGSGGLPGNPPANDYCTFHPTAPACESGGYYCREHPTERACRDPGYCDTNPADPACRP